MIVRGINMIINGIDFEIVFNIKKIKRIYIRIKKIERWCKYVKRNINRQKY